MSDEFDIITATGGRAPVRVFATDAVVTLPPDATVRMVARTAARRPRWPPRPAAISPDELVDDQIGIIVLGSSTDVHGVVSERDVVRAVAAGRQPDVTPARDVGSTRLVWCDVSATVREIAERMMEDYVRHVLLEDDGRLVGIVSARDLLGAYAMSAE